MKMNPILHKELRVNMRTPKFPLTLALYNLALSSVAILMLASVQNTLSGGWSIRFSDVIGIFDVLGWIQCVLICFIIPVTTACSIAGEKERQTFDILLTTSIDPFKIVTGKLIASIYTTLLLVLSSIPTLTLSFVLGGMEWQYIFYFAIMSVVISILVGSIGIFCSALAKTTQVAIVLTFLSECFFLGVTSIGTKIIQYSYYTFTYDEIAKKGYELNIKWSTILVLFNPIALYYDFMQKSLGKNGISEILYDMFDISYTKKLDDFFAYGWIPLSLIFQLVLSFILLKLAAKLITPIKNKR